MHNKVGRERAGPRNRKRFEIAIFSSRRIGRSDRHGRPIVILNARRCSDGEAKLVERFGNQLNRYFLGRLRR